MLTKGERKLLEQTRARIAKGWTQGVFARDAADMPTICCAADACKFCLVGALTADDYLTFSPDRQSVYPMLREKAGADHLPTWNDTPGRTQEEVLALIDSILEESC